MESSENKMQFQNASCEEESEINHVLNDPLSKNLVGSHSGDCNSDSPEICLAFLSNLHSETEKIHIVRLLQGCDFHIDDIMEIQIETDPLDGEKYAIITMNNEQGRNTSYLKDLTNKVRRIDIFGKNPVVESIHHNIDDGDGGGGETKKVDESSQKKPKTCMCALLGILALIIFTILIIICCSKLSWANGGNAQLSLPSTLYSNNGLPPRWENFDQPSENTTAPLKYGLDLYEYAALQTKDRIFSKEMECFFPLHQNLCPTTSNPVRMHILLIKTIASVIAILAMLLGCYFLGKCLLHFVRILISIWN